MASKVTIAAAGDISFAGPNAEAPSMSMFSQIIAALKGFNLVIGNLESPLVTNGDPRSGKCTIHGNPGWAELMKEAGIHLVSLANNHMMDYGQAGLFSTTQTLDSVGIRYVGAGRDIEEACAPLFLNVDGRRIAVLARTSVIVNSPSYAERDQPGVAYLDIEETKRSIAVSNRNADIVILLMHWGLENYSYPSPDQRQMAKELIGAGADIILGHHPHVLQGVEFIKNGIVAYSLGNFLFDEFEWTLNDTELGAKKLFSLLSGENREGVILNLTCGADRRLDINPIFTRIDEEAKVKIDYAPYRNLHFKSLNQKLHHPFYQYWWHVYAMEKEWTLRIKPRLSVENMVRKIHKLRMRHIKELFGTFRKAAKIVAGKSTNPYD